MKCTNNRQIGVYFPEFIIVAERPCAARKKEAVVLSVKVKLSISEQSVCCAEPARWLGY